MDFLLVFPLILAILSTGQSKAQVTSSCYTECPAGFHKDDECGVKQMTCQKCENHTFTAVPNSLQKCIRCRTCGHYEMEIKPCFPDSDAECDCREGYYNTSNYSGRRDCKRCPLKHQYDEVKSKRPKRAGAVNESEILRRCVKSPECLRKCIAALPTPFTSTSPSPSPSTTSLETPSTTTTTASAESTSTPNSTGPIMHPVPIYSVHHLSLLFVVPVVFFLALFWILLLFPRNPCRYSDNCPCWRVNKALEPLAEEPMFNDQRSHHVSSPTTQTLNISEETPMMPLSQSPAPSEYQPTPAPVLLDAEHKAARQDGQSEHWPAIVLYTIIKEVPLRRWKEFLRLLSVADQQLERVELEAGFGLGSMERQYQMLRLWSQRSTSSLDDVFSALHYMDLSGCAQLLQESLEKLQWRPELKQGCTDHGAMQDT
ncbi:LOW QUALITY PROTEIN: tumor necrosis factor receptor superfamily member 1A [Sparus aurata]|uniref:LOW QUALITY PROTEIN: tumor necrosis factor receptor superfamily member 1A n=1 Tax=Sparus aurata TaxID=8175 RepID=UPI0011C1227C|nr:LOW QUALITY PROTEIN: tumor necrosis factor receptor superfamily member 1A-like [Sparus aurata]